MSVTALLQDLRHAINESQKWGYSRDRFEEIVRKYSIQTKQDTSAQPGEWQIRGGNVEAIQHDGTVKQREEVQHWIRVRGGQSTWSQENGISYIHLDSPRTPNVVGPDWWVVHTEDGVFYAVSDTEFHIIYIPKGSSE